MTANGNVFVLGSNCDGSDWIGSGSIASLDVSNLTWNQLSTDNNSTTFSFDSDFISIAVECDQVRNITYLIVEYMSKDGMLTSYTCPYSGIFETNEAVSFYIGSSDISDEYYQLKSISFGYCNNEWDIPNTICEDLFSNNNLLNMEPNRTDVINIINDTDTIHGWFNESDELTLMMDEMVFFDYIVINFTLYLNKSRNGSYIGENAFDIVLTYFDNDDDDNTKTSSYEILSPTRDNCYYYDGQLRSYWYLIDGICVYDGSIIISNIGIRDGKKYKFAHNLTMSISYNENDDDSPVYRWGVNNICINVSDDNGNTRSPTPSPTTSTFEGK